MRFFLFLFILLPTLLFSIDLKRIEYQGLVHISPVVATEMIDIQEGERIDVTKVNKAIVRFYEQGYFKDIWVMEEDGVLTFHFKEYPIIANIEINGYGQQKEEKELYAEIGLKKGDIYTKDKIEKVKKTITEALENEGYFDSQVEESIEEINENSIKLTLDVNEGEKIIVTDIKYCGADEFDAGDFESVTANREKEWLGWMWGFNDGELKLQELPLDNQRIKDVYMEEGYLDAEVSPAHLQADFNTYEASLTYKIKEGKPYTVTGVRFELTDPVAKVEDLQALLKMKVGRIFNISKLRKDMEKIKEHVANFGYAFTIVNPDLDKNQEESTVEIVYYVIPGKKVYINDVLISGNTRTLDRVIRREIILTPGDLYNLTDLTDSKNALKRRGYFETIEVEEKRVSEDTMDLLVKVEEAMTGEFKFGVGYGSYGGMSFSAGVSDRNVMGSGMKLGTSFDISQKSSTYNVSLDNPRVLDSKYSMGVNVFRSEFEAYDYTSKRVGGAVTGGRKLTRHWSSSLTYAYTITRLEDVASNFDSKYIRLNDTVKSSLSPGISFDNTDDYLLPRNGMTFSSYIEYAGLGGDETYTKNYNQYAFFYDLDDWIDRDVIFRYKARAGFVGDNGYLPISAKFFLGGLRTLRGYRSGSVSPLDDESYRIGGTATFSNSVEASFGLLDQAKLRLATFYDYGMLGESSISEITRSSYGFAVEWMSPIGPLHLIFPQAIAPESGDKTSTFEFSMGQRF